MIVVEEDGHEDAVWHGDEYPFDFDVPEINDPGAIDGGVEGAGDGEELPFYGADVSAAEVHEAGPEEGGDWVGVVGEEGAEPGAGESDFAEFLEVVNREGEEDSNES